MKVHPYLLTLTAAALTMNGCSTSTESVTPSGTPPGPQERTIAVTPYEAPSLAKETKFHNIMVVVAKSTKQDPNYRKLSLDTPEEKSWFKRLMYRLWDRQITRAQFISKGVSRYPEHKYEFTYIANAFQNY